MYDELFCDGPTWHSLWARMFAAFSEHSTASTRPGDSPAAVGGGRLHDPAPPAEVALKQTVETSQRVQRA